MDVPIRDTGISIVYEPDIGSPVVDIIIVHGLQGHPYKTWACKGPHRNVPSATTLSVEARNDGNGSRKSYRRRVPRFSSEFSGSSSIGPDSSQSHSGMSKYSGDVEEVQVFWPKDLLPVQYPNARVLVYGYDTKVTNYLSGPTNENSIHSHGMDLLCSLAASRKLDSPLILIAHSLGGIVVKEMLASSSNSTEDRLRNVVASTAAVIFLGTPHKGSADLAKLGDWARTMISAFRVKTNPAILDALRLKTNDLARAQESFSAAWSRYDFRVKTFQEGLGLSGLNFGPFGRKVVPDNSSLLGDVRERAETIQANHMDMCRFRGLDDPNYARICGELTSIYNRLAVVKATTANTLATPSHKRSLRDIGERERIFIQSLLFPNMNQRTYNLENPVKGTCSWFFEHEEFVDWFSHKNQTRSCGLLMLKGKPGSGKSTLLKETFFRVAMETSGSECHVASFFFNAKGDALEHSPTGMLRSLLHQLCSQNPDLLGPLLHIAQSRRALCGEDMAAWDEAELKAFFKSAIDAKNKRKFIFIDAIDECDSSSARDVADFWRETTKTAHRAGVPLSVCLSSRYFPYIGIKDCPEICMEAHNHADIVEVVNRRLDLGMTGKDADRQAIQEKILEKSGGVFLWVSLVLKDILRKHDEGQGLRSLLKHLDSVPLVLEDLFRQLLTAGPSPEMVARMFQWALLPTKPLRVHEWHHILAFIGDDTPSSLCQWRQSDAYTETDEQLEKRITHLSRGLLAFNTRNSNDHEPADDCRSDRAGAGSLDLSTGETRVVQVIHESVRQFFLEGPGFAMLTPNFVEKPLAHAHLSIMCVCLDYILIDELDALVEARNQIQRRTVRQPGLADEEPEPGDEGPDLADEVPDLATLLKSVLSAKPPSDLPHEILQSSKRSLRRRGSVASFGSASSHHGRQTSVQRRGSVASFGSASSHHRRQTPVDLKTHHKGVQLWDKVLGERSRSNGLLFPMYPSEASRDDLSTFRSLKELTGPTETQDVMSRWLNEQSVTAQSYRDEPTAHISPQASVTGRSQILEDHPALLSYAMFELFTHARKADAEGLDPGRVVHRLRHGVWDRWKALREDADGRTELLYFAAELGLSSWLKAGRVWNRSEVNSSINFAIENDDIRVLAKLLEAFPSAGFERGINGRILALLQAYLSRHPDSMNSAMALNVIPGSKNEDGRTALHLAVIQQNEAGVFVLLKAGADVSAVDSKLSTPLHLACMNELRLAYMSSNNDSGSSVMVELLLDHHAPVNSVDADGRTPLFVACSNITLRPWEERDLSTSEKDFNRGASKVVDLLLKHGADVNISNFVRLLPLHKVCMTHSRGRQNKIIILGIVRKLLDHGSLVDAKRSKGITPLHDACASLFSHIEIVEELLRRGADPLSRDHEGRSPLHIATARSTEQVVETLLSFYGTCTSVDVMDYSGSTPLHVACNLHTILDVSTLLASMRLLLAHGARAYTIWNRDGHSPADVARKSNFGEALEMLAKESWDAPF